MALICKVGNLDFVVVLQVSHIALPPKCETKQYDCQNENQIPQV